ncbi:MAG TPA: DUF2760 domain-containing protein [Gemmataceae bacterium]|nr:DUF2760 domain-containing protein [Gemmataceae bacterium]
MDLTQVLIGVIIGLVVGFGLLLVGLLLVGGGSAARLGLALRALGRTLRDEAFAGKVGPLLAPPAAEAPPRPSGAPLRLLAIFQRDGRLIDFLTEDLQAVTDDAQVGAAVREIHRKCQEALKEHLVLEPVLPQNEGETVEVPPGFDPSAIRVTGNVPPQPPFRGTLLHRGWRVREIKLPPLPQGQDEFILQPAEVEVP